MPKIPTERTPVSHFNPYLTRSSTLYRAKSQNISQEIQPINIPTETPLRRSTSILTGMFAKLLKNSNKAIQEHLDSSPTTSLKNIYAQPEDVILTMEELLRLKNDRGPKLIFNEYHAERQGVRPSMQDAHVILHTDEHMLTGVFDGHGSHGEIIATTATAFFEKQFLTILANNQNNVSMAFRIAFEELQKKFANQKFLNLSGSTAIVCYLDKKSNFIYTATLGDSEAFIIRNINSQPKCIPLSCVRNWSSKNDKKRAIGAGGFDRLPGNLTSDSPKTLRYKGLNVSRAIGDVYIKNIVSQKPKITVQILKPGDKLLLACDGLFDFATLEEIVEQINSNEAADNPAAFLADFALHQKKSLDNITVITMNIGA